MLPGFLPAEHEASVGANRRAGPSRPSALHPIEPSIQMLREVVDKTPDKTKDEAATPYSVQTWSPTELQCQFWTSFPPMHLFVSLSTT